MVVTLSLEVNNRYGVKCSYCLSYKELLPELSQKSQQQCPPPKKKKKPTKTKNRFNVGKYMSLKKEKELEKLNNIIEDRKSIHALNEKSKRSKAKYQTLSNLVCRTPSPQVAIHSKLPF